MTSKSVGIDLGFAYVEYEKGSGVNVGVKASLGAGEGAYAETGAYAEVSFGKKGVSCGYGTYAEAGVGAGPVYAGASKSNDSRD